MSDTAGTTRDRQYGKCEWNGREFSVVDTGGWVVNSDDVFEDAIREQVKIATAGVTSCCSCGCDDWCDGFGFRCGKYLAPFKTAGNPCGK